MLLLGLWRSLGGLRLSRAGSATGSAVPSITFAASPARCASISRLAHGRIEGQIARLDEQLKELARRSPGA